MKKIAITLFCALAMRAYAQVPVLVPDQCKPVGFPTNVFAFNATNNTTYQFTTSTGTYFAIRAGVTSAPPVLTPFSPIFFTSTTRSPFETVVFVRIQ